MGNWKIEKSLLFALQQNLACKDYIVWPIASNRSTKALASVISIVFVVL